MSIFQKYRLLKGADKEIFQKPESEDVQQEKYCDELSVTEHF